MNLARRIIVFCICLLAAGILFEHHHMFLPTRIARRGDRAMNTVLAGEVVPLAIIALGFIYSFRRD